MRRRLGLSATIALALVTAAGPAAAGPWGGGGHHHKGPGRMLDPERLEMAARRIGLDEGTLQRIKERAYEGQKTAIPIESEIKAARLELHKALDADNPDRAEVMRLADQLGRAQTKMKKHHLGVMLDIHAMLTPDQRAKLKEMMHERRAERREGRGRRFGPGGPPSAPQPPAPPSD